MKGLSYVLSEAYLARAEGDKMLARLWLHNCAGACIAMQYEFPPESCMCDYWYKMWVAITEERERIG